jgi:cytosine/adenosine deaminase-related metal-dependent hydrolase
MARGVSETAMNELNGVLRLGRENEGAVDISFDDRIADIRPSSAPPSRRRLVMPALVNAHDHCRALSPTSFGGANKPLELWLIRLAAMPAIDPYLGALAAFGRAARGGAGSVMAHYTRFHTPDDPVGEARAVARAAREVGVRVTLAVFMRDRNPIAYGASEAPLDNMPEPARAALQASFGAPQPTPQEQIARVEAMAAAVEDPMFSVQFGPSGAQWCSDELLGGVADASARTGRRVHMHYLETRYQRAFADAHYGDGLAARLEKLGFLSPRLTLAHCVWARDEDLDAIVRTGTTIATNPSSNLHLASGIAPIGAAIRRGARVALGVDASAFDEDDDIVREMRLGAFLHGGWGFEQIVSREDWLKAIVENGRRANGAPGSGAVAIGEPADFLVLDLDRLDRDSVMPVEPLDYLFARATAAHIEALYVAGRQIVADGRPTGVDLGAVEAALRAEYRERMPSRAAFLAEWPAISKGIAEVYGCC